MNNFFQLSLFDDKFRPEKAVSQGETLPAPAKTETQAPLAEFNFPTPFHEHYRLVRSRRRTLCLYITETGLEVRAPLRTSLRDINAFVKSKEKWILKKLRDRQLRRQRLSPVVFADGGSLLYRGEYIGLKFSSKIGPVLRTEGNQSVLHLPLSALASEAEVRQAVLTWLIGEAARVIGARYRVIAARVLKPATRWRLSNARTQWGSCSADGSMRFSWRLIFFEDDAIDYVIAHELAHRVHMNHSAAFWKTVELIKPDFRQSREKLKAVRIKELPL